MPQTLNLNMESNTNSSENNTDYFKQGIEIGKRSEGMRGILQNPYPRDTVQHSEWALGWFRGYTNGFKKL